MKIITYNVNGIRSALNKGLVNWLKAHDPDLLCLQEIKLSETYLVQPIFEDLGYHCFWYPAQKKGYSGVAILSKTQPIHTAFGMNHHEYDFEGRCLRVDFEDFSLLTSYFPSGSSGEERQTFKIKFLHDFYVYIQELRKQIPNLIICGDVNICHQEIDIHNPKANANTSGFLPQEREWIGKFIDYGFIDTFRFFNNNPHHYTWWSYRAGARAKNLGWRIDYLFASETLQHRLKNAVIHSEVMFSDHCPVELIIS
jgi:exodeoxyribonuclease-3